MFICDKCKSRFDEPVEKPCRTGEYDHYNVCPECRSDEISEAAVCEGCGEYCPADELEDGMCGDCRSSA